MEQASLYSHCQRNLRNLCLFGVAVAMTVQTTVQAQPPAPPPAQPRGPLINEPLAESLRRGRILMNYENIDLRILARIMSELTGKNILLDDKVQGKITVLSTREVTAAEAYDLFKAALERFGMTVHERKGFTIIQSLQDSRKDAPFVNNPKYPNRGEGMTLGLVVLKRGDSSQLVTTLRPLMSDPNSIQAYQDGKALIFVDKASIVAKVAETIRTIDKATPTMLVSVIIPKYAEAERVVPMLNQVMARQMANPGDVQPPRISAFGPTNAVMIQGTAYQIKQIKSVLARLDIPRAAPDEIEKPQFYVHFLQYAGAEETAKILGNVLSERKSQQQQELALNAQNLPLPGGARPGAPGAPAGEPYPRLPGNTPGAQDNQRIAFVSAKVASDKDTNSLILFISPTEYKDVQGLLAELDVPRKQVLMLSCVAETSLNKVIDAGAKLQVASPDGILSSFRGGLTEEGLLSALAAGNFAVGTVGSDVRTINVGGREVRVPTFFAFLTGNKNTTDFNLISSPRLLTSDHKEATMEVGNVVPFATGARFDNFGQPLVTYDYKDVGIKLKVTPHISQSDTIRLDLDQEVQEVTDFLRQNLGGFGYVVPLISNRSVKTYITVKEGETLLIGGLVSKKTVETISKVPILGDLPLIDNFFKETHKEDQKTTLFIALTPYIVNHPDEIARLDRPYQEFLHGDRTPRDHEIEDRETQASRHAVPDPYGPSGMAPPPVASLKFRDLDIQPPQGSDLLRQGRVEVTNTNATPVDFVIVQSVRGPGGNMEQRTNPVHLESGQTQQVMLPPYKFSNTAGTYEFDLRAVVGDDVVARLPLPKRMEIKP